MKKLKVSLTMILALLFANANAYDFSVEYNGKTLYFNNIEVYSGFGMDENERYVSLTYGDIKYAGDIEIPSSVEYGYTYYTIHSIGAGAFNDCVDLTSVIWYNYNWSCGIYSSAFRGCSNLESISISSNRVFVGAYAFSGCTKLTEINCNIDLNPEVVGSGYGGVYYSNWNFGAVNAFEGCESLSELPNIKFWSDQTLHTSDWSINSWDEENAGCFSGCNGLQCLVIGQADDNGYGTDEIHIPSRTFENCTSIKSVTIGSNVRFLGKSSFKGCANLSSVTILKESPDDIGIDENVFENVPLSNCTLYVAQGSINLYKTADQWKDFGKIKEILPPVELADGESYTETESVDGVDVVYTRTFNNTEWQPLYVPFNMSYDEWKDYADVAEVHNVRGYDNNGDEQIDEVVIEFNKLTSGEIVPNVPYVIRAKSTGSVTFECSDKTLLSAPTEEGTIECSSTKMTYSFHGIYQPKTDMYSTGAYTLTGGVFCHVSSDAVVLSPNRFYLMVTPKNGGYNPVSMPAKIRMSVIGEDEITGIESVTGTDKAGNVYYDLMGRRVVQPENGIYIVNGRKVIIK